MRRIQSLRARLKVEPRVVVFGGVLLALIGFVTWIVHAAWVETSRIQTELEVRDIEGFRVADRAQTAISGAQLMLQRFLATGHPGSWEEFARQARELDQWITERGPEVKSPREQALVNEVSRLFRDYQAWAFLGRMLVASGNSMASELCFQQAENVAKSMWLVTEELEEAHSASLNAYVARTLEAVANLQRVGVKGLVAFVILGGALAYLLYRQSIWPLLNQLDESEAIIQRQERLASLGVLAAGIAHEIRNPLTSIRARLYTQRKALEPGSRAQRDGDFIGHEIDRLEKVLNEFLSFARPQDPVLASVPAELPLREVTTLLQPQLEGQGIEVNIEVGEALLIEADSDQIKQVMINLVKNAAEAMEGRGRICLRAAAEKRMLRGRRQGVVVLSVEDNGPGIPAEIRDRLFDPFFTTKAAGTGLGLAICARIVERHGGEMTFESGSGRTVFHVVLPQGSEGDENRERIGAGEAVEAAA